MRKWKTDVGPGAAKPKKESQNSESFSTSVSPLFEIDDPLDVLPRLCSRFPFSCSRLTSQQRSAQIFRRRPFQAQTLRALHQQARSRSCSLHFIFRSHTQAS